MKVSFVIPSYNNFPLVNQLLVDIHDHTKPDEIIVVDDGSKNIAAIDGLAWWRDNYGIKVLNRIENLGFLKASNYGMKKAIGGIICLISTDVEIKIDLVQILKDLLKENPKRLIGGIKYDHNTGWNTFNDRVFPYLEGWLLATGKEQWEELGYFDERYAPHDAEDLDLSTMAIKKGYELYALNSPSIKHLGAQTIGYNDARLEITKKNIKTFEAKWLSQN